MLLFYSGWSRAVGKLEATECKVLSSNQQSLFVYRKERPISMVFQLPMPDGYASEFQREPVDTPSEPWRFNNLSHRQSNTSLKVWPKFKFLIFKTGTTLTFRQAYMVSFLWTQLMMSSPGCLKGYRNKVETSSASKLWRSTFLFRENGLFSVSWIFSSLWCVCVGMAWSPGRREVVPFWGLP